MGKCLDHCLTNGKEPQLKAQDEQGQPWNDKNKSNDDVKKSRKRLTKHYQLKDSNTYIERFFPTARLYLTEYEAKNDSNRTH